MLDCSNKNRLIVPHLQGTKHGASRFTEQDIIRMRELYLSGVKQTEIAKIYDTTQSYVSQVIRRQRWAHI